MTKDLSCQANTEENVKKKKRKEKEDLTSFLGEK